MNQLTATTEEVEAQEVQDILDYFSGLTPWAAQRRLIAVLVANGSLTLAAVERVLGKDE